MQYASDANIQWSGGSSVAMVEDPPFPGQWEMFGLKSKPLAVAWFTPHTDQIDHGLDNLLVDRNLHI